MSFYSRDSEIQGTTPLSNETLPTSLKGVPAPIPSLKADFSSLEIFFFLEAFLSYCINVSAMKQSNTEGWRKNKQEKTLIFFLSSEVLLERETRSPSFQLKSQALGSCLFPLSLSMLLPS